MASPAPASASRKRKGGILEESGTHAGGASTPGPAGASSAAASSAGWSGGLEDGAAASAAGGSAVSSAACSSAYSPTSRKKSKIVRASVVSVRLHEEQAPCCVVDLYSRSFLRCFVLLFCVTLQMPNSAGGSSIGYTPYPREDRVRGLNFGAAAAGGMSSSVALDPFRLRSLESIVDDAVTRGGRAVGRTELQLTDIEMPPGLLLWYPACHAMVKTTYNGLVKERPCNKKTSLQVDGGWSCAVSAANASLYASPGRPPAAAHLETEFTPNYRLTATFVDLLAVKMGERGAPHRVCSLWGDAGEALLGPIEDFYLLPADEMSAFVHNRIVLLEGEGDTLKFYVKVAGGKITLSLEKDAQVS